MSKTKVDQELRDLVVEMHRDKFRRIRCKKCTRVVVVGGFEIDHIKPEADGGLTDPDNLQVLCVRKEGGKKVGCHMDKTRQEARERAKKARGPQPLGLPLFGAVVGSAGLVWAYLDFFRGPQAAHAFLTFAVWGTLVAFVPIILGNVVIERHLARPLENDPAAAPTPKTPGPAGRHDPPQAARITSAAREVIGKKGDVRAILRDANHFGIHYPGTGFDDSKQGDGRAALIEKIEAKVGGRWQATWDTEHDTAWFARRPELPRMIPHPGFAPDRPWNILPIAPRVVFDLLITSHILIAGKTNSGKTSLLRAIVMAALDSAARGLTETWLFDPKRIEFLGFRGQKGVSRILTDAAAMWDAAIELEAEMVRRYRLLEEEGVPLSSHPRLIVVIDEFERMVTLFYRLWQESSDPKYKKKSGERLPRGLVAIREVLAVARRCGIHVVASTQSPDASNFGGSGARENMEGRAAVGRIDQQRARMVFDDASVGRDLPIGIKGRATMQILEGEPEEVQTFWVPDPADSDGTNTDQDWEILKRLGWVAT